MNYARFFSLFRQGTQTGVLRYAEHGELVADATQGRTSSLRDLTPQELRTIEQRIAELVDPQEAARQRMRRKVIAILAARGTITPQGKPDMVRVLVWVMKYGYLHKPLNAYTYAELPQLVTQAERIAASDLNAVRAHD